VFSRCSVAGSLHVAPPSVDLLARIALSAFESLNDSAIWWTTLFGENVTWFRTSVDAPLTRLF
jgi:hypothetical protein